VVLGSLSCFKEEVSDASIYLSLTSFLFDELMEIFQVQIRRFAICPNSNNFDAFENPSKIIDFRATEQSSVGPFRKGEVVH